MLNRTLPQAGKQSYAADRQSAAPFDSLLDETARPAPEPRANRASDDNSPRAERPKPADRPDRASKADDSAMPSDAAAATTDTAEAAVSDIKTVENVAAEQTAAGGETKTDETAQQPGETKPAEAAAPEAVAVVIDPAMAAATAQADAKADTLAETKAVAATATTTAAATPTDAAEAGAEAAAGEAVPDALAALAAKVGKADKAETKTDDKPAHAAKAEAKAQSPLHPDVEAAAAAEPHKDSAAHASAEETANNHRGVATEQPATTTADKSVATAVTPKTDLAPPPALMTAQAPAHSAPAQGVAALAPTARAESSSPAVPIGGVAFEITSKVMSGKNSFDIRLDPADLGRIHVRLDVDRDGNVVTHMTADRSDTLDMLRRDTAGLERALQDAGLKTSDNSLQFSLRDQSNNQQQSSNSGSNTANIVVEDEQTTVNEPAARNYAAYRGQTGGLDIRV